MTCFWDGILSSLDENDFQIVNEKKYDNVKHFIDLMKRLNRKTDNVRWNNELLTVKQLDENYIAIEAYDKNTASTGYLCSICDPFLLLIAELFKINIHHKYLGTVMMYTIPNHRKTVYYKSDNSHFTNTRASIISTILPQKIYNKLPKSSKTMKYSAYVSIGVLALNLIRKKENTSRHQV